MRICLISLDACMPTTARVTHQGTRTVILSLIPFKSFHSTCILPSLSVRLLNKRMTHSGFLMSRFLWVLLGLQLCMWRCRS